MTHTNHQTCTACGEKKLIREFRDSGGRIRQACNDCREHRRQRERIRDPKPELASPIVRALRAWR